MKDDDIKRNGSGYYDPTAYFAIKNSERDSRSKKREEVKGYWRNEPYKSK